MKRFDFLKTLEERFVILDGAMGTMLQRASLTGADFGGKEFSMLGDLLNISRPEEIKKVHIAYLDAGANAVETNTFGSSHLRLEEYDFSKIDRKLFSEFFEKDSLKTLSAIAYILSRRGAEIAKESISEYASSDAYDGRPLFAIGSAGPSNYVLSPTDAEIKKSSWEKIENNFYYQALGLIDGGADVILFETQQDILELKAAVSGAFKAMKERAVKLPVMAQVTVTEHARMQLFNTDIHAALCALVGIGVDVFGINCSIGPDLMEKAISKLSAFSHLPISVLPNAGMPVSEDGKSVYKLSPESFAAPLKKYAQKYGVNILGGCCGTTPEHIKQLAEALKGIKPASRNADKRTFISGPQEAVLLDSSEGLIRIGERLNVRGSKKVREAVETPDGKIDFGVLDAVAGEQFEGAGLNILDVCMDSNSVSTVKILPEVIRHICKDYRGALSIDSFEPEAIFAALEAYPGRPLINSISLEEYSAGKSKLDLIVPRTRFFNPVYIALAADGGGPAVTADEKIRIAGEIIEKCLSYGLKPEQIFIDINAFPIGSESDEKMNFALESIKAIPGIKALAEGVRTSIGAGNLTNGLGKKPYMRKALTSVFLDEAVKNGLDAALVNPAHYVPAESLDKKDYALALKIIMDRDMSAFSELEKIAEEKKGVKAAPVKTYEGLLPGEKLKAEIIDALKRRSDVIIDGREYTDLIVSDAASALDELKRKGGGHIEFINGCVMPAMQELGARFSAGEVSLPHLLRAADLVKQVMAWLEDRIKSEGGGEIRKKGTVVVGTVYQDVHSIGKDLVKTLFENYGYRVVDLGVQVSSEKFIESAIKEKADALSVSALLVQTSGHMLEIARMMKDSSLNIPLLIGGAPVNLSHAAKVAEAAASGADIKSDVFYCASAMDGVNTLEVLFSSGQEKLLKGNLKKLKASLAKKSEITGAEKKPVVFAGNYVQPDIQPFVRTLTPDLKDLDINYKSLKNLNWKMAKTPESEFREKAREWLSLVQKNRWIVPKGVMAVFPATASGSKLFIYDIENPDKKIAELLFPRGIE
ncbi:MAG: homocysteine S-methyltransferase family protein, partial [Elusimicrobia bacterium]|nr:homocysteine S-methyltransferase family protein [Elusimicrobiota bacterium]